LVDGFVEAPNSTVAIDRLADKGIIGVHTVRPEPQVPKNAVRIGPDAGNDYEEEHHAPRLEASRPEPRPAAVAPVPAAPAVSGATDALLTMLVEKLGSLTAQVEKLLSRPAQVVYQNSGPVRDGPARGKKTSRTKDADTNQTLRDIFLNNLDLRQGLEKLASATGTAAEAPVVGGAGLNGSALNGAGANVDAVNGVEGNGVLSNGVGGSSRHGHDDTIVDVSLEDPAPTPVPISIETPEVGTDAAAFGSSREMELADVTAQQVNGREFVQAQPAA
jgi:hypothetical protein